MLKVIDVACPKCKAKAGDPCVQKGGAPLVGIPHMVRRDAWWDAKRKRIAAERPEGTTP